jgi:hypothetical protein
MMVRPDTGEEFEYRFVKCSTHNKAEEELNKAAAEGWQLVTYQAAGGDSVISHFLVLSRSKRPETRRFGFGS